MRMIPQKSQLQQAAAAVAAVSVAAKPATPSILQDIETGFDMLKNFNFSQIADAAKAAVTAFEGGSTLTVVESVGQAIINAGTVAGNPIAIEAQAALPVAEKLLALLPEFTALFGGTTGVAAAASTAISSPRWLGAPNAP